jgi:hypothetical protein
MPDSKNAQLPQQDLKTVPETSGDGFVEVDLSAPFESEADDFVEVDLNQPTTEPTEELEDLPEPVAEVPPIDDDQLNQIKQVSAPETLSATPLGLEIGDELVLKSGTPSEGKNEQLAGKKKFLFEEYSRPSDSVFVDADGERLEFSRVEFENLFQLLPESVSEGVANAEEGGLKSYSFDLGGGAAETEQQSAIVGTGNPIENEANTHLDIEVGQEWQDPDLGGLYIEKIVAADGKGVLGIKFKNTDEIREITSVWGEFFKQMILQSGTSVPQNGIGSDITREVEAKIDEIALKINQKVVTETSPDIYEEGKKVEAGKVAQIPVVSTEEAVAIPAAEAEAEKAVAQVIEAAVPQVVAEEKREEASDTVAEVTMPVEGKNLTKQTDSNRHAAFSTDTSRPANSVDAADLEAAVLKFNSSTEAEGSEFNG